MSGQNVYLRAPLVEAVLAIQIKDCGLSMEKLAKCRRKVKQDYPKEQTLQTNTSTIEFGARSSASTSSELLGYAWTSADDKKVFQAKRNGFSFSLLAPYTTWSHFNSEARKVWDIYRKTAQCNLEYTRVGLRYINRFDFPSPTIEMSDYFNVYTQIPPALPQAMESFFFQVAIGFPESKASVNIIQTQAKSPPDKPNQTSILFDIDVSRREDIPAGEQFWGVFDELAKLKNTVFESSITQKSREVIK